MAEVVLHGAEGHEALHAAHRAGRAVHHLHVLVAAQRVDRLPVLLTGAAPASRWQGVVGVLENIQGSAKRRGLGCVNSLPGSAWL